MMSESYSEDDYKKRQDAVKKALEQISKSTGSKAAKKAVTEKDDSKEVTCCLIYQLVDESIDLYKSGEMDFKEMVEDLHKALMAIKEKPEADEESD